MKGWRWPSGLGWARRGRGLSGSSQSLLPLDPRSLELRGVMGEGRRSGRYLHLIVSWWWALRGAVITCTAEESAPQSATCPRWDLLTLCAHQQGQPLLWGDRSHLLFMLPPPCRRSSPPPPVHGKENHRLQRARPPPRAGPSLLPPPVGLSARAHGASCPGSCLSQPQLRMDWAIQGTRDNMKPTENFKKKVLDGFTGRNHTLLCS